MMLTFQQRIDILERLAECRAIPEFRAMLEYHESLVPFIFVKQYGEKTQKLREEIL